MRSRSALDAAGLTLGSLVEGVWCGALAAVLTGSSWALLSVFAAAVAFMAAAISRWRDAAPDRNGARRGAAVALVVVGVLVLLAAGRAWAHDYLLWQVVRDVLFVGGLAFLGVRLGEDDLPPEAAVRRATRSFALLCGVLVCAAVAGVAPGWASAAVVGVLVLGGLFIAAMRYRALTDLVASADRLPPWPWFLVVTGVVVAVVAVAALLGQLLDLQVLRWVLDLVAALLSAALDAVGWVVAWAGMGLLRALEWLLGLLHLPAPHLELKPPGARPSHVVVPRYEPAVSGSSGIRQAAITVGALVAITASLALVLTALGRLRRRSVAQTAVVEEREKLNSVWEAAGGWGRRLRRRISSLRRPQPCTPAELIRLRYARLEERLAATGWPRPPGTTVRAHLAACATSQERAPLGADLAALYELARYSGNEVGMGQVEFFDEMAEAFGA
jgi:hypothetical protein